MKQEQFNLEEKVKLEGEHFDILRTILRKNASFLAEISAEVGVTEYNLRANLYDLRSEGMVQHILPDFHFPQWQLLSRVSEMSNKNQGGFSAFCAKRWFVLTEKGLSVARKVEVPL